MSKSETHVRVKLEKENKTEQLSRDSADLAFDGRNRSKMKKLDRATYKAATGLANLANTCYMN
jgi:ubiquitin C-terminal hydrolase